MNRHERGFSYVEVLVASSILALALVPALDALQPGIKGIEVNKIYNEDHYQLIAKMESLLAEPSVALQTAAAAAASPTIASSYTDTVTFQSGRQIRRLVYLSAYDGDNADGDDDPFTGTDQDLIWIKVSIDGTNHAFESLSAL